MALVKCDECGAEISGKAASCPRCGVPRMLPAAGAGIGVASPERKKPRRIWPWAVAGCVVAFFAIGFAESNTPEGKAKTQASRAIELCWQEQQRKSLSTGEQRFVAGACEKMESDYRQRFGRNP